MNQKVDLKMTPWINKPGHRQVSDESFFLFWWKKGLAFNLNGLTQIITRAETMKKKTKKNETEEEMY